MAKYIEKLIGSDERITFETHLHWIVYLVPVTMIAVGVAAFIVAVGERGESVAAILLILFFPIGILALFPTWIRRATTEIAVTTRRIVYKRGWISRQTIEISFNRIESLDIKQSVLGRIFDFGTVIIRGTGIGVQPMHNVAAPLQLRNAAFGQRRSLPD
jgi:membrane protein YdbS with pleckstrin-like domain